MVDFSDIMPTRIDTMHRRCPVCETGWYIGDDPSCPICGRLYDEDVREHKIPSDMDELAFTLKIWQKYRMVERLYREGKYTEEQMKKLLHEVDECAINEFNERRNEQKERWAEQEQQRKRIQDLTNRNNYSY